MNIIRMSLEIPNPIELIQTRIATVKTRVFDIRSTSITTILKEIITVFVQIIFTFVLFTTILCTVKFIDNTLEYVVGKKWGILVGVLEGNLKETRGLPRGIPTRGII